MTLEDRVAAVEQKIQDIEERRRRLIPAELDENPAVKMILRDSLDGFTERMKMFAAQKDIDAATTRFNEARQKAFAEFERIAQEGKQAELARDVAAIDFFDRFGFSPPGYDISVKAED